MSEAELRERIAATLEAWQDEGKDYIVQFSYSSLISEIINIIKEAGYHLPVELKALGDEDIKYKLEQIQPEGFDWENTTFAEMIKYRAIAQAQVDDCMRQIKGE